MPNHAATAQQLRRAAKCPGRQRGDTILERSVFRRSRHSLVLLLAASVLALGPEFAAAQEHGIEEYELKAAILYNLTKFVEWPPATYPDAKTPTALCILGRDPFGSALASLVDKKDSNGRPLLIRHLRHTDPISGCHVLFISTSERKTIAGVFASLQGAGVLTVGEMDRFAVQGGMIQFTLQEKEVRFEINRDAASREGLKISSRLLALARVISDH